MVVVNVDHVRSLRIHQVILPSQLSDDHGSLVLLVIGSFELVCLPNASMVPGLILGHPSLVEIAHQVPNRRISKRLPLIVVIACILVSDLLRYLLSIYVTLRLIVLHALGFLVLNLLSRNKAALAPLV